MMKPEKATTPETALRWLKHSFGPQLAAVTARTPIPPALLMAIAWQETGLLWGKWASHSAGRKPPKDILASCVGDTLDAPRRSAFPRTRAELEAWPQGKQMFQLARKALIQLGKDDAGYARAAKNPDKFCHGFGMFQLDIQAFKVSPAYFLEQRWATIEGTASMAVSVLMAKLRILYGPGKLKLTTTECVYLAIAYNQGRANMQLSAHQRFKQGFKDASGVYYGEHIAALLPLCEKILAEKAVAEKTRIKKASAISTPQQLPVLETKSLTHSVMWLVPPTRPSHGQAAYG